MSIFALPQNLQIKQRGIKVDGYSKNRNGTIDLSWSGQQRSKLIKKYSTIKNSPPHKQEEQKEFRKAKVMTDTTADEQELLKLIKARQKSNKARNDDFMRARSKQQQYVQRKERSDENTSKSPQHQDISSRIRYLENNLLPKCRQDNVNLILDQSLNEQVSLSESRHQQHHYLKVTRKIYRKMSPRYCQIRAIILSYPKMKKYRI